MAKPRILLVDDEERFRNTLQKLLAAQGLAVTAVESGQAALEALEAQPHQTFDVVLLDIRMPGLSGIQTLAAIKQLDPNLEVIMLTGHASMDAALKIIQLGAYDYLLKPCPTEELLLKIEAAYDKKVEREKRLGRPLV
jgi:DNA-binding NtrC family response regulator